MNQARCSVWTWQRVLQPLRCVGSHSHNKTSSENSLFTPNSALPRRCLGSPVSRVPAPRPAPTPPPWAACHPHSAGWASARLTSACCGAAGSICCFTNRKVILRSCQHLSASIMRTHANTHAGQPVSRARACAPPGRTHTLGSATHKAVNNRKWCVAETVSVQLDGKHSCFIFPVHVDTSSIFPGLARGFTPSRGLSGCCSRCSLLLCTWQLQTARPRPYQC